MIIAGLTGGIASGKSTVADLFKGAGAVVLDADAIARQVVSPGRPAWQAIIDSFGKGILNSDGTIDRGRLGRLVFDNTALRRQLERIIHPHVYHTIESDIIRLRRVRPDAVVIQDIPLLFETGMISGPAEIIVVYTPRVLQLKRLMQRDAMDMKAALARIEAQMPIEEKCRRATMVIINSGELAALREQVSAIYRRLSQYAEQGS